MRDENERPAVPRGAERSCARPTPLPTFPDTQWSAVRRAAQPGESVALSALCKAYWYPVYSFVRGQGCKEEDARDVTQGFFAMLLERNDLASVRAERGRFRSWLRTAAKRYLLNELKHDRAKKRGGGRAHVDIDVASAEGRFQRDFATTLTPDQLFDRCWARTVAERALARLKTQRSAEYGILVEQLLAHEDDRAPDTETAATLGITVQAVRTRRCRLWGEFAECLEAEISRTVNRSAVIDAERAELINALF